MEDSRNVSGGRKKRQTPMFRFSAAAIIFAGLLLMVYPFAANLLFEYRKESAIRIYRSETAEAGQRERARLAEEARAYNETLSSGFVRLQDPFLDQSGNGREEYQKLLSLGGTDLIGTIRIPCIGVDLPIYHGTSPDTLERGVGHLEGSSLPVGGTSTHSVLTGHTGLGTARLFTDLLKIKKGDTFALTVLGTTLSYRVDQISVTEPSDTSKLSIEEGRDLCTLVTCTPYGVNSHRLLVRGTRIFPERSGQENDEMGTDAEDPPEHQHPGCPLLLAGAFAAVFAAIVRGRGRKRKEESDG